MSYERYNFISKPAGERHIEKMSVISKLFGFNVKETSNANVLDLGVGTGDNLISMAYSYPNSNFIGIDNCKEEIEKGQKSIEKLGLKNISLLPQSFSSFKSKVKFDYIIAHGIFSWVNEKSRKELLKNISKNLSDDGVAYISFNSSPGCVFRDLLIKQISRTDDKTKTLEERIKNLKNKLDELKENLQDGSSPYTKGLLNEIDNIREHSDSFFVHEILNENYKSFTLEDFISYIKNFKLSFFSDASLIRAFGETYKQERLEDGSFEAFETYVDYILPKQTRGVLITKKEIKKKINLNTLDELFISSPLCYTGGDKNFGEFTLPSGSHFEFDKKSEIDFFKTLESTWPKPIKLYDLNCILQRKRILDFFSKEFINFYTNDLKFSNTVKETPKTSDYAKIEIEEKGFATNFRNEYAIFNDFQKRVFLLLDGTKTKEDISKALFEELGKENQVTSISKEEMMEEINKTLLFFKETAYLE